MVYTRPEMATELASSGGTPRRSKSKEKSPISVLARIYKLGAHNRQLQNCKRPIFQGRPEYTNTTTINMYLLIEIGHNIFIQCHGICIGLKNFN